MRIVDEDGNDVAEADATAGSLSPTVAVRRGAEPPDGVRKHAYADDDYEEALLYHAWTPEEAEERAERERAAREAAERERALESMLDSWPALASAEAEEAV